MVLSVDKKVGVIRRIDPTKIRGKYNRVMSKALANNKKKYSNGMFTHMQGRFDRTFDKSRGFKKDVGGPPPGASLSGWKE